MLHVQDLYTVVDFPVRLSGSNVPYSVIFLSEH
jgi:hypothetical protein